MYPRHLWVKTTALGNRIGNGSTTIRRLLACTHKLARANISLLQQASVNEFDELEVDSSPASLNTWAKRACVVNAGKNNYREEIVSKLRQEGYKVSSFGGDSSLGSSDIVNEGLKETRSENYQQYCQAVPKVETPTDSELEKLRNKRAKTPTERLKERKGILNKRYGVEVTPTLVEKDDDGWYPQLQLHYYLTVGKIYLPERDKRSLLRMKDQGNGKVFKTDINKNQLLAPVKALEIIEMEQFFDPEREFTASSLDSWLEKVIQFRHDIKTVLSVSINPEKDSAIAVAQRILKKLGLKLEFKYWRGDRSSKQRVYGGCNLDPDKRSQVFDNWLTREDKLHQLNTVLTLL